MAVTDEAIEKIKAMIVGGAIRPGDRLPGEAELAGSLGLSRNSLREAVRALALMRILDVRQGDGTYIASLSVASLVDALGFLIDFQRDASVLEIFEVRRILEPAATALAAATIGDDLVAELQADLDRLRPDSTVDEFVTHDLRFHLRIAQASGNALLASLIDNLSLPTQRARIWRGVTEQNSSARTLAEHGAILDAVRRHEPDEARAWATVHIAGIHNWLRTSLARDSADTSEG